jgi:uncharacterized membrane protein
MVRLAMESPGRRTARGEPRLDAEHLDDEVPRRARERGGREPDRDDEREAASRVNVNGVERAVSMVAGGALAAYALKRKDIPGLLLGVVGGMLVERGVSGRCHVYGALGLTSADEGGHLPHRVGGRPVQQHGRAAVLDARQARRIERAVTVYGRSREELYAFWRDFGNLPRIMEHLEGVQLIDDRRSRWVVKGPGGKQVSWEAVIHNEIPGELIAWKSGEDADVPNAGSVHFTDAPGGRGTEVRVVLEYEPPAGKLGVAVARLFGEEPGIQVREDLRRFKQLVETGELPVSEIPGQGPAVRDREFNARTSNDERLRASTPKPGTPHDPRHVPTPADEMRGVNTTELTGDAWR